MTWIAGLMALGFALIMMEIFIPGGIVGLFGGLCLIGSVWASFDQYGLVGAIVSLIVSLIGVVACLWFEFKVIPKTAAGKRLFLQNRIEGKSQPDVGEQDLVGQEGTALTALSPTGYVKVGTQKLEAFSRSGFLDKGQSVKVEAVEQFRITVSKI